MKSTLVALALLIGFASQTHAQSLAPLFVKQQKVVYHETYDPKTDLVNEESAIHPERIERLAIVEEGLFRGALPETPGKMETLRLLGIRTIISLADNKEALALEKAAAKAAGIRVINVPLNAWKTPRDEDVAKIERVLNDPSLRPLYLHCKHGRDRTGFAIGLYRVRTNGWEAKEAYQEAKDMGYRSVMWPLRIYFKRAIGLID